MRIAPAVLVYFISVLHLPNSNTPLFRLNRLFHGFVLINSNRIKFYFPHNPTIRAREAIYKEINVRKSIFATAVSRSHLTDMTPEITYIQQQILRRKREVNRGQFFS